MFANTQNRFSDLFQNLIDLQFWYNGEIPNFKHLARCALEFLRSQTHALPVGEFVPNFDTDLHLKCDGDIPNYLLSSRIAC